MPEINDDNYYEDTTHISNSMIGDYLKSPEYFELKHVKHTIHFKETPQMIMGSAVDCILTEGLDKFHDTYSMSVLKKEDPVLFKENKTSGKIVLSKENFRKALAMSDAVSRTPAFKWLLENNAIMQPILKGKIDGVPVKGKLDFLTIVGDTAYVDDLKTTSSIEPYKYFYHSIEFGYNRQACMYRELVKQNFPQVKKVINRHIVCTRDGDYHQVGVFDFDDDFVDNCLDTIIDTLHKIKDKKFDPLLPSWDDAIIIGGDKD